MPDNSWNRSPNPPPKLFTGKKELDLVKQINVELEERVLGQQILYYPLDIERSNYHNVYGEAINKVYFPPIHVFCLIDWEGSKTVQEKGLVDRLQTITLHFHNRRLVKDQELFVQEGDAICYGENYYEIVEINQPTEIFGYPDDEYKMEISVKCTKFRAGAFNG